MFERGVGDVWTQADVRITWIIFYFPRVSLGFVLEDHKNIQNVTDKSIVFGFMGLLVLGKWVKYDPKIPWLILGWVLGKLYYWTFLTIEAQNWGLWVFFCFIFYLGILLRTQYLPVYHQLDKTNIYIYIVPPNHH